VSCSHKTVSAVSNPNSVGKVPCRLFWSTSLESTTQQHHPSETLIQYLKWRERVSTGVVLSQPSHRRHQSNLCWYSSGQPLTRHAPVITPSPTSHTTTSTPMPVRPSSDASSKTPSKGRRKGAHSVAGRVGQTGLVRAGSLQRRGVYEMEERVVHEHQRQPQRRTRRAHTQARHGRSG
jgi:hypothetical protein